MAKVIPFYTPQKAEVELTRLNFEREYIKTDEHYALWFSHTLELTEEQEAIVRERLGVPKGRFEGLKRKIEKIESSQKDI